MNTSIYGDKIIVLWQVLLAGGAVAFSVTFGVWLMGRKWRKKGEQPPSLARRGAACATLAIFAFLALPVALGLAFITFDGTSLTAFAWLTLPGAVIIIGCLVAAIRLMKGWGGRVELCVVLILFVCHVCGAWCLTHTGQRMTFRTLRVMDQAKLHGIGRSLVTYHDEYEVYPDDLRRLVDNGTCPPEPLLGFRGTHPSEVPKPRSVPYQGPCDFIYIHLPEDAPDDLVWVWQPLEHYDGDGGNVLFKDGDTRWMKAERLKAEIARTHKWLETHPTTQPATAPAG